jgi:Tol biopolymer transport system component
VTDNIGQSRTVLFDGGTLTLDQGYVNVNDMLTREVTAPRWSPDGSQIAFGYGGVNFIPKAGGVAILALANTTGDTTNSPNMPVGAKIYRPHAWSPDGTRLVAAFNYVPEGGGYAIFPVAGGAALEPKDVETGFNIACCEATWSLDSSSVYFSSPAQGIVPAGLWLVNAATGDALTLIRGWQEGGDSSVKLVGMAEILSDGKLYYFYGLGVLDMGTAPLNMFRADADGLSGQTMLRADAYEISEAVWSPDGSGAVIADQTKFDYGNKLPPFYFPTRWLRADGGDVVTLPEVGQGLRWGVQ